MAEHLQILARLSDKAKEILEITGDDWYFVDYAPQDVTYGKYGQYEIHESMDQFQRKFPNIPCGWQVVARISGIDKSLLPEKHAWYWNENFVKIDLC